MSTATQHPDEVREVLKKAGLSESAELDSDQLARAKEADIAWSTRKLHKYVMEGATTNGEKPKKERDPKDEKFAKIAADAMELAAGGGKKLGSPISGAQARKVRETMTARKISPGKMFEGKATGGELLAYAQGGKQSELPEEARTTLREFCKLLEDRRIWPRKVVAIVLTLQS